MNLHVARLSLHGGGGGGGSERSVFSVTLEGYFVTFAVDGIFLFLF